MFIYSVIYFIRFDSKRVTKILFACCMYVVNTLPFFKKKNLFYRYNRISTYGVHFRMIIFYHHAKISINFDVWCQVSTLGSHHIHST